MLWKAPGNLQSSSGKAIEKVWDGWCEGNGEHHEGSRNAAGPTSLSRSADVAALPCKIHSHDSTTLQSFHLAASGGWDCGTHICDSVNHKVCDSPCFTDSCKCFTFVGYKSEELPVEGQFSSILLFRCCCSNTSDASFSLGEKNRNAKRTGLKPSHIPGDLPPLHLFLHRISDFPCTQFYSKLLLHV